MIFLPFCVNDIFFLLCYPSLWIRLYEYEYYFFDMTIVYFFMYISYSYFDFFIVNYFVKTINPKFDELVNMPVCWSNKSSISDNDSKRCFID